jgi:predicted transglutaminase-like cysteine proteinase
LAFHLQSSTYSKTIKTKNMKKIFVTMFALAAITTVTQAQEVKTAHQPPVKKEVSKAEKEVIKAKAEADLVEAFKQAGLTDEEQKKFREITAEANEKNKVTKADTKLSEEEKQTAIKATNDAKNAKLKDALGPKYKTLTQVRKAQKDAPNSTMPAPTAPVKE